MKDREIDEALERAAGRQEAVDQAVLDRIAAAVGDTLRPVRPLPKTWVLAIGLAGVCAVVAMAGAARAGFYGIEQLNAMARALIFLALAILVWTAGAAAANEMIPGSRRRISAAWLVALSSAALLTIFGWEFRDYRTEDFVHAGLVCLAVGLLHAAAAGVLAWWVLRRGFAVNPVAAGLAVGTLAGLAGVGMLELHCNNFQALHILVWHTAVVPASALAGALVGWWKLRKG